MPKSQKKPEQLIVRSMRGPAALFKDAERVCKQRGTTISQFLRAALERLVAR